MADFAKWGACISEGLGYTTQQFLDAYQGNIAELNELALEAQPFAQAVIALVDEFGGWEGTATQLLGEATRIANGQGISTDSKAWPGSPAVASKNLRKAKVNLQQAGIEVIFPPRGQTRRIRLKKIEQDGLR